MEEYGEHLMKPKDHVTIIAEELKISSHQVQATAELLANGATIPFIARYRKEATGSLDEVAIQTIRNQLERLEELDKRREAICKSLEERELLTKELKPRIEAAWEPMAEMYGLNLEVVNPNVDPTFSFMTVDKDGKIRMDCSSPYAMASLIGLKDTFDVAFGNDPDYDRHGIVTKSVGLMNPNHYLAVAVWYLFQNRPNWREDAAIGKTLVSSSMIDRVAAHLGRKLSEVPVGFKWFVDGLIDGSCGFGGEESAGASFLRLDGSVWTTDKDGIILDLLAAEITATTGTDPGEHYKALEEQFGSPVYERMDVAATPAQKAALKDLSLDMVEAQEMAGEKIIARLTHAPGNNAAIGGLKVVTENGWFAARPSGTEDIYKIYAESFKGKDHLQQIREEAQAIVNAAFQTAGM